MATFKQCFKKLSKRGKYVSKSAIYSTLSLLFVKVDRNRVNVYVQSKWGLHEDPIVTLYKDHVTLHYCPDYNDPLYWKLASFLKIKFKWIYGRQLILFSNRTRFPFFKGMKILYNGLPLLPYPKKYLGKESSGEKLHRLRHNARQRLYYHRKKANERFIEAAEWGPPQRYGFRQILHVDVSKLPMDDVFKLQNVSHRQFLIDYYGLDAILASLDSKVLDKDVINGNPYELIEVVIPFSQRNVDDGERSGTYLRMVNPSTDEIHFEGVPNYDPELVRSEDELDRDDTILKPTVKASLAWRDGETRYTVPKMLT